ncbi:MAG: VOC family protein [Planctomycetes bacterium]|nr:VOC family protein [Planctomycetota bacterium]
MATRVKAVPDGFHTVTPSLSFKNARAAIAFYGKAFGATSVMCMAAPDGGAVMHAEIKIGDSILFLNDESPAMGCKSCESLGGSPAALYLYVEDADAVFQRAVAAGAQVKMPVTDMFWGDRCGAVIDPFGYSWSISTHTEDVPEAEIESRQKAWLAEMAEHARQAGAVQFATNREELALLRGVLDGHLAELRREISRTDHHDFRRELEAKETKLAELLKRLP